jgi:predicted PurR-regulated permease PerM
MLNKMLQKLVSYLLEKQVLFALVIILFGWMIYQIRDILVTLFIAYIIAAALQPAAHFLQKRKFPVILAVFIPYLAVLIIMLLLVFPLFPFFFDQVRSLITRLPNYLDEAGTNFGFQIDPRSLQSYLNSITNAAGRNAIAVTTQIFGGIIGVVTILVLSFYLLLYRDDFRRFFTRLFHKETRPKVRETMERVDDKLGAWLRGQVLLSFVIGLMTYTVLSLLGLPYALPLALLAGFLEVLPTIGPIISAVPAVIVAFTISPSMALVVACAYFIIQLLENNLLVPKIMQHAVGLNPLIVIIAILIGGNLMGIVGALLAIPFISFIIVLYKSLQQSLMVNPEEE